MKRKKTNWALVPWTPFEACVIPTDPVNQLDPPMAVYRNSRYQVTVYGRLTADADRYIHLSFKVHDRQAWHDWRDMQRIKNELCGPECEAVELYPAESRLVDSANQYHLFVWPPGVRLPFGFTDRLVGDGHWQNSKQRSWPPGERPADAMDPTQYDAAVQNAIARERAKPRTP